ncbi:uncharacterized protein LOC128397434 [Panonychus citri]|uniref:uncharacterized protein LOC128397434 n=1 Tax=Panonychus citri TaxID=50023 RepID=UPI002307A894|nr:uncharacterized protein LOC128397434 [Panonychus citri]
MSTVSSKCRHCGKKFKKDLNLLYHQQVCRSIQVKVIHDLNFVLPDGYQLRAHAFFRSLNVYSKCFINEFFDIESVIKNEEKNIKKLLETFLQHLVMLKVQIGICCEFYRYDGLEIVWITPMFNSSLKPFLTLELFEQFLDDCFFEISLDFDTFTTKGSGWTLNKVKMIEIRIGKYVPLRGGCFNKKLPDQIIAKRAIIQLESNKDCFIWSILASLFVATKNACRIKQYQKYKDLIDFSNYSGYVKVDRIKYFECRNNISVNVYTLHTIDMEKYTPVPLHVSRNRQVKHANLLLYQEHYWPIRNFNRFIGHKNSRYHHFCENCFTGFLSADKMQLHTENCYKFKTSRILTPQPDSKMSFTQFEKMIRYPFVIYADFETLCKKIDVDLNKNTFEYQEHLPSSYGYVIVDYTGKIIKYEAHRGPDSAIIFLQSLKKASDKISRTIKRRFSMLRMSVTDEENFKKASSCHICNAAFTIDDLKVRDHDHFTGLFRGAAHENCNLRMSVPDDIPVVFHNLKNFDAHILMKAIQDKMYDNIKIIPQNTEKYISFSFDKLKFIDSYAFLSGSLDILSKDLDEAFKNGFLLQLFKPEDLNFVSAKAKLPYDYIDDFDKFGETTLPDKNSFYNQLNMAAIDDDVYENMVNLWNHFNLQNLGEFQDVYQKIDVVLLAAVFENFRKISNEQFQLDPPHFYSAPGLTWAAALKSTNVQIDLLSDIDMIMFFEKGIRGGISSATKRYEKANIPDTEDYDNTKKTKYMTYLDVNNLYGFALQQTLPISDFKFEEEANFEIIYEKCMTGDENNECGYVLEVDLVYPDGLHDLHNDYPLAPEKLVINNEELSSMQQNILTDTGRIRSKSEKLMATFHKRTKYVLHQRNLKFYILHGLKLTKIHRIVSFKQSTWLKEYILHCTEKRMLSKSSFEKNFWKLLVNAIYGKSIEDVRKHTEIKFELSLDGVMKQMQKPLVERFYIIDENKAIFKMRKKSVLLNKPIYTGFTVLELSKLHMFQLHYDIFKSYYNNSIQLLYTDTDSFIYSIETLDIYNDFKIIDHIFDFSDYPTNHSSGLYSDKNKKKLGYLKDEMMGKQILEFIALKSKVYTIRSEDFDKKTAKGVQRVVLKEMISFEDYKAALFQHKLFFHNMRSIKSNHHDIKSIQTRKLALNPFDDKRYILDNGVDTLAYGHYRIREK